MTTTREPQREPLSDERIDQIRTRVEATSPGPWESETAVYGPLDSVHIAIRTRDKLPEHPWSPRFIAWLTGAIAPVMGHTKPPMRHCDACDRTFYRDREVPIDIRADEHIQADATFIAHAPMDVRDLLADNARLRARDAALVDMLQQLVRDADNTYFEIRPYAGVGHTRMVGPFPETLGQARALLAPTPDASAQGTEGSEASSDATDGHRGPDARGE